MALSVLERAYRVAATDLRACYDEHGIVAGRNRYDDYWTRDAAFGWMGALELGDFETVKRHLKFLASLQHEDGMIPFLVREHFPHLPHVGIKIKVGPWPRFRSHKVFYLSKVIDSNPYFVIGFADFLKKTGDAELLEELLPNLEVALSWCLGRIKPGEVLASQGLLAGWNDGVYKSGKTLMTNVLFLKAFREWEILCGNHHLRIRPEFLGVVLRIRQALNQEFFTGRYSERSEEEGSAQSEGSYFIDWVDREERDFFDANANLLAILWNVASTSQANQIVNFALEHAVDWPLVKSAYPPYPKRRLEIINRLFGVGDYWGGDGVCWLEPACLLALCLEKLGRREAAQELLTGVAELIVGHDGVHEVYVRDEDSARFRPVRRRFYRAEHPYARGAGLYITAYQEIVGQSSP